VPPGFLCRILGRRRIGIRMAAGGTFARPGPTTLKIQFLPKQPAPSPLFTAPATQHRRSPFSCRACSCFATFSGRRRTHAASAVIVSAAKPSTVLPPLARRFPSASSSRCRDPQKQLTTQPVAPALRGNVSWRRGLLRCARNDGECGHALLFSAYPRSPSRRRWHQNKKRTFTCELTPFVAYSSTVEFVWLRAATFVPPGPLPSKNP
jgi:hypothetical protein